MTVTDPGRPALARGSGMISPRAAAVLDPVDRSSQRRVASGISVEVRALRARATASGSSPSSSGGTSKTERQGSVIQAHVVGVERASDGECLRMQPAA